jgi:hypothetical protein
MGGAGGGGYGGDGGAGGTIYLQANSIIFGNSFVSALGGSGGAGGVGGVGKTTGDRYAGKGGNGGAGNAGIDGYIRLDYDYLNGVPSQSEIYSLSSIPYCSQLI